MQIRCPDCQFERDIDLTRIPASATVATCPRCGRRETPDQPFERIRRITGYLVGTLDRFNNGKRAEERDRVKHGVTD